MPRGSTKRRHNLPARRVRLLGREDDLVAARRALLGAEGRLLTLSGTGGCGKTRLALALASEVLPHFPDGVWLVELAGIADPTLVPQSIASALSVREQPGESLIGTLVRALSRRELLLVLDNCEHLIEMCAQVAEGLLDHCSRLRVLTTSREALRISAELTWRVPSLEVPDPRAATGDLLRSPAVQLFVERAQAAVPGFAVTPATAGVIGRICARLNGLPLAIELAAARVNSLGVEQIHDRLDDGVQLLVGGSRTAPTRQQTLRATLDWSYALLGDGERTVLRRLAVFAESCSLDAAEAVCVAGDVAQCDVLDLMQRLVDKSLIVVDEGDGGVRYRLLEPIRQYAAGQLVAYRERDLVQQRHALHFVAFGEARDRDTNQGGARRQVAMAELAREYPNIRNALACLVERQETQLGLRLAGSLLFLWQIQGSASEGIAWLARLLALPGADEPTVARAGALVAAARLSQARGDFEEAQAFCQEALSLARRLGEPFLEFLALLFSVNNALCIADVVTAEHFAREALACARSAGDPLGEGQALMALAMTASNQADYAAAQPFANEALRLARVGKDAWNSSWALAAVGRVALGRGALHDARAALKGRTVSRAAARDPPAITGVILDELGELEIASGQPHQARAWLLSSLDVRYEGGEFLSIAPTLGRLAALAARRGEPERALRLAAAADALYKEFGGRPTQTEQMNLERWLSPVREALGELATDDLWAQGEALELDETLTIARGGEEAGAPQTAQALPAQPLSVLTQREQQVAALLTHGLSNRQIAEQLVITERTVASHIEHILEKLGFASRHQVGAWVVEHGLIG